MADFVEFVAARRESLWRTAWALTGDAGKAEDLVQTVLLKVWPRWGPSRPEATTTRSPT